MAPNHQYLIFNNRKTAPVSFASVCFYFFLCIFAYFIKTCIDAVANHSSILTPLGFFGFSCIFYYLVVLRFANDIASSNRTSLRIDLINGTLQLGRNYLFFTKYSPPLDTSTIESFYFKYYHGRDNRGNPYQDIEFFVKIQSKDPVFLFASSYRESKRPLWDAVELFFNSLRQAPPSQFGDMYTKFPLVHTIVGRFRTYEAIQNVLLAAISVPSILMILGGEITFF